MAANLATDAPPSRVRDRAVAACLLVLMAAGSLVMWTAVPAACMWAASKVTSSGASHFLLALPVTVVSVGLFALLLVRLNRLYLRITGGLVPYDDEELDEDEEPRYPRGPLEPMLVVSLGIALTALFVWFFLFAKNPSPQVF